MQILEYLPVPNTPFTQLGKREIKTWMPANNMEKDIIMRDIQHMDISREDTVWFGDKATNRNEWKSWIALCA